MISAASEKGFFAAHWDWLVAAGGILALAGGAAFLVLEQSNDPEMLAREAGEKAAAISRRTDTGVEKVDMIPYDVVLKENETPSKIDEPGETLGSFLGSEKRVFCEQGDDTEHKSCGRPMPADLKVCPFCKTKQPEEKKQELDSDGDGLSDEWELAHGMNPHDASDANADSDGDGYTNFEEFEAGTDPQDPASHPDDLDSLKLQLPLDEEKLPFYLERDKSLPYQGSWRVSFRDDTRKNDYGRNGVNYVVMVGKEISRKSIDGKDEYKTGYTLESFEQKTKEVKIKGSDGMTRKVDASVATIVRKADGKRVRLEAGVKHLPVDTKAKLLFTRGQQQEFPVIQGDEFDLNGTKYKVLEIKSLPPSGAKVILKNTATGKTRTIAAP